MKKFVSAATLVLLLAHASVCLAQDGLLKSVKFIGPTPWEHAVYQGKVGNRAWYVPNKLYADRAVYWNDDHVGQFLVSFMAPKLQWKGKRVTLEVIGEGGAAVYKTTLPPMTEVKAVLLLAVNTLKPGKYTLRATLPGADPIETAFERADKANPVVPFPPEGVEVFLDPQDDVKDGAWAVTAGVPFPQGTIEDVSTLALFEDGKRIPAQIEQICTWHPEADGVKASVSWAWLSFVGHYKDGKPAQYRLRLADPGAAPEAPAIKMAATAALIIVENGVIRFMVNPRSFRGVQAAWYDANGDGDYSNDEKVIAGKSGAYVVDAKGVVYEAAADRKPKVVIEEKGPVRLVIAAEGWYTRADRKDQQLCKFVTRIICYAGDPSIRVEHRTILTFDSDKVQLADVGMRVPVSQPQKWVLGRDDKTIEGDVPERDSVFLHQYRWNRLRIVGRKAGEDPYNIHSGSGGAKSEGWFTLTRNSPAAVTVFVRDIWQKFPKEVEMDRDGFTLHFWPKHGGETFTKEEMLALKNVYKLWWYDQGRLLDLKFPQYVYQFLGDLHDKIGWDPEHMKDQARTGNAQGVAIGNQYILRFHKADATDQQAQAALAQRDPHARSDPKWNVETKVEGDISAYDPKVFPALEEDIDTYWSDYMKAIIDHGTEYGMWIYTDVHDNMEPARADLHRVWSASHYRNVSTAWLLYFRGNSPENRVWAAANTDHFMDIDTINYASSVPNPKRPGTMRAEFLGHVVGAMYHAKGFTPWGNRSYADEYHDDYLGLIGHYTNADAFRYCAMIEGNRLAWDMYLTWGAAMRATSVWPNVTRENINTYGDVLAHYTATWDPDFIPFVYYQQEAMMSRPLVKMPHSYDHPGWHRFWHTRAYDLLRDERIVKSVVDYCETFGKFKPTMLVWAYRKTGDKKYLEVIMPAVYDYSRLIYRNPDDPLSGFRSRFAAYSMFFYQEMPYYIQALKDAGITEITLGNQGRSSYPFHTTHFDFNSERSPALQVVFLKTEDHDVNIRMESIPGYDTYVPAYRVLDPEGKVVLEAPNPKPRQCRYLGDNAIKSVLPKDGKTGLYRLDLRTSDGAKIFAPYTDVEVEGAILDRGQLYQAIGRLDLYLMPIGDKATVDFAWIARQIYPVRPYQSYVRLEDAQGNVLLETTLLAGSKRDKISFTVDTAKMEAPYHLYQIGGFGPRWDGTASALICAETPEKVRALAIEVEKLAKTRARAR